MTHRPVVGVVGNDVPRQLVAAAGVSSRRLTGSWAGPVDQRASELLGAVDAVAARILTGILTDPQGRPDDLVICNDSQAHLRLFYVLRLVHRDGGPRVHLLDLPRHDSPAARTFAAGQLRELTAFLAEVSGTTPDASSLRAAAEAEQRLGAAVARLRERRRSPDNPVPGTAALEATLRAMTSPDDDPVATVDAVTAPAEASSARVHLSGSGHPDATVYAAIERTGITIVSDDHDTGDLAWFGATVDSSDFDEVCRGLVDAHFARDPVAAVGSIAARAATTASRSAAAGAQAAVILLRPGDDAPAWDLAATREALSERGIPVIVRGGVDGADPVGLAASLAGELAEMRTGQAV